MCCLCFYMQFKLNFIMLFYICSVIIVGLCGYMRYPNFLREDWLNRILSWQSKSEVGCFLKSAHYPANVISSDVGIKRQASSKEQALGDQPTEMCLPHFTATSLLALSTYFDYLLDSQVN